MAFMSFKIYQTINTVLFLVNQLQMSFCVMSKRIRYVALTSKLFGLHARIQNIETEIIFYQTLVSNFRFYTSL